MGDDFLHFISNYIQTMKPYYNFSNDEYLFTIYLVLYLDYISGPSTYDSFRKYYHFNSGEFWVIFLGMSKIFLNDRVKFK